MFLKNNKVKVKYYKKTVNLRLDSHKPKIFGALTAYLPDRNLNVPNMLHAARKIFHKIKGDLSSYLGLLLIYFLPDNAKITYTTDKSRKLFKWVLNQSRISSTYSIE